MMDFEGIRLRELALARLLCQSTLTEAEARRELGLPELGILVPSPSVPLQAHAKQDYTQGDIDWDGVAG